MAEKYRTVDGEQLAVLEMKFSNGEEEKRFKDAILLSDRVCRHAIHPELKECLFLQLKRRRLMVSFGTETMQVQISCRVQEEGSTPVWRISRDALSTFVRNADSEIGLTAYGDWRIKVSSGKDDVSLSIGKSTRRFDMLPKEGISRTFSEEEMRKIKKSFIPFAEGEKEMKEVFVECNADGTKFYATNNGKTEFVTSAFPLKDGDTSEGKKFVIYRDVLTLPIRGEQKFTFTENQTFVEAEGGRIRAWYANYFFRWYSFEDITEQEAAVSFGVRKADLLHAGKTVALYAMNESERLWQAECHLYQGKMYLCCVSWLGSARSSMPLTAEQGFPPEGAECIVHSCFLEKVAQAVEGKEVKIESCLNGKKFQISPWRVKLNEHTSVVLLNFIPRGDFLVTNEALANNERI